MKISIPDAHGGREHEVEVADPGAGQFAARLRKMAKERRRWAAREGVAAYRVYDADLPDFALSVDLYLGAGPAEGERYAVVCEYQAPASVDPDRAAARFGDAVACVPHVLDVPCAHVFAKRRVRAKGGGQYAQEQGERHVAFTREGGYLLELDFGGHLDTGLFLDHRATRLEIGRRAAGLRFLNLFAYTGSATVHAAGGGAARTLTVDLSRTYLDWARRNMAANGFDGPQHAYLRADCTAWVREAAAADAPPAFDLVFCDPPTFSNGKAMGERTWDVQRDHAALLADVGRLLAPGGAIVFSTNLRRFKLDGPALAAAGLLSEDVTARTVPHDFERTPRIHSCYLLRRA